MEFIPLKLVYKLKPQFFLEGPAIICTKLPFMTIPKPTTSIFCKKWTAQYTVNHIAGGGIHLLISGTGHKLTCNLIVIATTTVECYKFFFFLISKVECYKLWGNRDLFPSNNISLFPPPPKQTTNTTLYIW